ncbi:hypothetical protein [Bifidobacterium pullorum]|uniref:ABC transmembrane type-1 domain-containing protein n=1 Tax=Bifidobacterium pullorum subsp. gallinarum TaxID=78344 RepID=A0A921IXD8_9BIFI|nr:hypothetical protein [Bifidobacterium pullorum]HJG41699.1 hypothetical protein [Bifidobacterium pullorum subsp. gallinarum]
MNGVRLIAQYLGANRRDFLLALLCVAAETSLELAIPMLMAQVIDEGIMARNLNVVFTDGGLMIVCALAALGLGLLYARYSARAAMGTRRQPAGGRIRAPSARPCSTCRSCRARCTPPAWRSC